MYSHPSIALKSEMRAVEERMGISRRTTSVGRKSQATTLGEYFANIRQLMVRCTAFLSTQVRRNPTNVTSSATS